MVAITMFSRSTGLTSLQAAIWFMYSPSVKMMFCPSACWPTLQIVKENQIMNYASFALLFLLLQHSLPASYLAWWWSRQVQGSQGWSWWPTWCGYWCLDTTSSPEDITALALFAFNPSFQFDLITPHIYATYLCKAQPRPLLLSVPDAGSGVVHVALQGTDRTLQGMDTTFMPPWQ